MRLRLPFRTNAPDRSSDVAIIGFAGRFPGARNVEQFWNNLRDGVVSISDVPESRWRVERYYAPEGRGEIASCKGGFIDGVEMFDASYFRFSESRAAMLAPQCRVLLETVAEAVNHAGYAPYELNATDTAVYIGANQGDYALNDESSEYISLDSRVYADKNGIIGNIYQNMAASFVSKHFNWSGPSFTLSSACSSSLVAIHLACQGLISGERKLAIAGAVQLHLSPFPFLCASRVGVLSPDGRTRTLSSAANGYALSEGVGAVLLKRLDHAIRDHDSIYGVIKASAVNNDGRTMSVLLANPEAQKRVMAEALQRSGISAATIGYLEVNGTALPLGDALEFSAAASVFRESGAGVQSCAIGSIEPNTGHMAAAAGMGRLFKILMAMAHEQLPPFLHGKERNPKIALADSPFYANDDLVEWRPIDGARRAGVNAFGFGGTNCHLIVEAFDPRKFPRYSRSRSPLPEILFERKRIWYEDAIPATVGLPCTAPPRLHPLVHHNTSNGSEQRFTSRFSGEEPFFADHRVRLPSGELKGLLPAVAFLEMARAALEVSRPKPPDDRRSIRFRDVLWLKPVRAEAPGGVHLQLQETPEHHDAFGGEGFSFEVYSEAPDDSGAEPRRTLHAQGRLATSHTISLGAMDPAVLQAKFATAATLTLEECYRGFSALGLEYGPAHRGLQSVRIGRGDQGPMVLGKVALSDELSEGASSYVLHPSVLDAVLQCAVCLVADVGRAGSDDYEPPPLPLPFSIEAFESDSHLPPTLSVWARYSEAGNRADEPARGPAHSIDIDGYDDKGERRLAIRGFTARSAIAAQRQRGEAHREAARREVPAQRLLEPAFEPHSVPVEQALNDLKVLLAPALNVAEVELSADAPLERYGIDSAIIVDINERLEAAFGNLSKTLLFEYQTLGELASYFAQNHGEMLSRRPGAENAAPSPAAEVASMPRAKAEGAPSPPRSSLQAAANPAAPANGSGACVEPIAIVGLSGRYPKAETLDDFWDVLLKGEECFTEIPERRWRLDGFYDPDPENAVQRGMSYSKWGAFLDSFAEFDPLFFSISPREAMNMDPQERLFLQASWAALEDAGHTRKSLEQRYGKRVGVFAGITKTGFDLYGPELWRKGESLFPRSSFPSVPNRVSYIFNLHGPSYPIDTMCSASLTAIHEASEHLRRGECELALAGGVNLYLHPANYVALSSGYMLSRDGRCRSFANGANGFVPGEGVGVVILKRLSDALQSGDRIHAIVKASSVNHGGKTNGYTVPNPRAQAELIRTTIRRAGISAEDISYIEAHGTGTELGDPIEFAGLVQAFRQDTQGVGFCTLGSVKSNIGHLEAAAGMAGLTKVILQMKQETITPSVHAQELNPNIDMKGSPFRLAGEARPWPRGDRPRIAGISSFGSGGANAHVLIEEYAEADQPDPPSASAEPVAILLTAQNPERLREVVAQLLRHLRTGVMQDRPGVLNLRRPGPSDIAYTLQIGREHLECRLGVIATSLGDLADLLEDCLADKTCEGRIFRGNTRHAGGLRKLFTGDADSAHLLNVWLVKKQLQKLVSAWVEGVEVDWRKLYEAPPLVVSLPAYPFKREAYWFDSPRLTGFNPRASSPSADEQPTSTPPTTPTPTPDASRDSISQPNLDDYLAGLVGRHLKLAGEVLDFDRELQEYGLDSIVATQIINDLAKVFPGVPRSLFLEHPTLASLKAYLVEQGPISLPKPPPPVGGESLVRSSDAPRSQTTRVEGGRAETVRSSTGGVDPTEAPPQVAPSAGATASGAASIIGMAAMLPNAQTFEQFWQRLKAGNQLVGGFPDPRARLVASRVGTTGALALGEQTGGYLNGIEYFDPERFRMSIDEARELDPQLRKLLEVALQAIENAGYTLKDFRARPTGVFVALNKPSGYRQLASNSAPPAGRGFGDAELLSVYANRISNTLNLVGPSRAVETGCSSFLVALKEAMDALRWGECDQAIVAAAELSIAPSGPAPWDTLGLYSRRNTTRSFCKDSDGYVKSEAIGAVVLKREDTATCDGDASYATIKGVGVSHGGKAPIKWYSPNIKGQKRAIEAALSAARVDPATVSYIEPEANGSQLGDASEIIAIQSAYSARRPEGRDGAADDVHYIGSMKPQTGHAEAASTLPVLINLIWSMKHATMLGTQGVSDLNEGIKFEPGFELLRGPRPWMRLQRGGHAIPRRGAVHSMSIGGVNAHLILEETIADDTPAIASRDPQLLVFSERSMALLTESVARHLSFLRHERHGDCDLERLAYTLQTGREQASTRLAVIANDLPALLEKLEAWLERGAVEAGVFVSGKWTEAADEANGSVQDLVEQRKWEPLARLWVAGRTIDWSAIYRGASPRRLHAPPSALQQVFCWWPDVEGPAQASTDSVRPTPYGVLKMRPSWTAQSMPPSGRLARETAGMVVFCAPASGWLPELRTASPDSRQVTVLQCDRSSSAEQFTFYAQRLFAMAKQLLASKPVTPTALQVVLRNSMDEICQQGLAGLLHTIRQESSLITGQLIIVDEVASPRSILDCVSQERATLQDVVVKYENGTRFVRGWREVDPLGCGLEANRSMFRDNGVFLIAGGAGGLGGVIVESLARQASHATIVLTGRSALSDGGKRELERLAAHDASVIYRRCDVTQRLEVERLIGSITHEFGGLHGIFHAAGVVKDSYIVNKSVDDLLEVLAPKVTGLVNLDEATKNIDLDFLFLFSSVAAVYGNIGQADYAMANAFMDAYARYRNELVGRSARRGRTISCNWPLWAKGGMDVDEAVKQLLKSRMHIVPMPSEPGLEILNQLLQAGESQWLVHYGDVARMRALLGGREVSSTLAGVGS